MQCQLDKESRSSRKRDGRRSPLEEGQLADRLAENQVHDRPDRETRVDQTQSGFDRSVRDQFVEAAEDVEYFRSRRGADKDPAAGEGWTSQLVSTV